MADRDPNGLTIIVNGRELMNWEELEVTLRAEGFPNSFSATVSSPEKIYAKAGDTCQILLGDDLVITGFVDRDSQAGDAQNHSWQLVGRGKTQDLVDCAGEWPTGQKIEGDALSIATQLASVYGINVRLANGASAGPQVPQWAVNYTETGAEVIQRLARNAGLLAYEDPNGQLLLANVGTRSASSPIAFGKNVQSWSVTNSMDERFSEIVCSLLPAALLNAIPGSDFYHKESDPNVPRHRQHCIVVEPIGGDARAFTVKRAQWEIARRAGRSTVVQATIDSWRDSAGTLWSPNTLVQFDLPGLRLAEKHLVLSEVTFRRGAESGTTASVVAMPKEAFVPEPISLMPVDLIGIAGNVGA